MARPWAKDGIRARTRSYDGYIEVHLEEYPGHWIATPEGNGVAVLRRHYLHPDGRDPVPFRRGD